MATKASGVVVSDAHKPGVPAPTGRFQLVSDFQPTGDQPRAITELVAGLRGGEKYQTLLGVTGSGKTFTASHVIQQINKPTLVLAHNKTLAAQLYGEFKAFFPQNAVEFFISYYDYYQPEAYIVSSDTFIEKDFAINDEIDRLRLRATSALLDGRDDVIIVASVSCIYGIGSPEEYLRQVVRLKRGERKSRNRLLNELVDIHYVRNDAEFVRGTFRVRGDVVELIPAYEEHGIRIEFFGDEVEAIRVIHPLTGAVQQELERLVVYPAKHFVTPPDTLQKAIIDIEEELRWRLAVLRSEGNVVEAQRLEQRTTFDLEMIREIGYCSGIENYSRHLSRLEPGSRPYCLLDYFPKDYLMVIDESHVTMPQVRGMYAGDRSRKTTLVEHGFRLPSALDNRPLKVEEFESLQNQVIFVSATPADYELEQTGGVFTEQVIRPTGLVDPELDIRPVRTQVDDLLAEIRDRVSKNERVLVTTLTKRMAEDLTDYLEGMGVRIRYLHSDIDALERVEILRNLRLAQFDVLVGINLLREGLDLPEVSLVAILDADKEGFLRSTRSLIQTAGRAARNANGRVILYADKITDSMQRMMDEVERRRTIQMAYNVEHGITPKTVYKSVDEIMAATGVADASIARREKKALAEKNVPVIHDPVLKYLTAAQRHDLVDQLKGEMKAAVKALEFERAAAWRDEIVRLDAAG